MPLHSAHDGLLGRGAITDDDEWIGGVYGLKERSRLAILDFAIQINSPSMILIAKLKHDKSKGHKHALTLCAFAILLTWCHNFRR